MMRFSVKTANYQQNAMLNICDEGLVGRQVGKDNLKVSISKGFYGERIIERDEAENLLKNSSIINMAGSDVVALSIDLGIGSEGGIRRIDGVPFLIVFKMS